MTDPDRIFVVGQSGSGKTTWCKTFLESRSRVLVWDWRDEYNEILPTNFDSLPELFARGVFRARFTPHRLRELNRQFQGLSLALLLLPQAKDFTLIVDEAYLVCSRYEEGGLGRLLRLSRPKGLELVLTSQRPTFVPGVFLSESKRLVCFHIQNTADLSCLSAYLPLDLLRALPSLKRFEHIEHSLAL